MLRSRSCGANDTSLRKASFAILEAWGGNARVEDSLFSLSDAPHTSSIAPRGTRLMIKMAMHNIEYWMACALERPGAH